MTEEYFLFVESTGNDKVDNLGISRELYDTYDTTFQAVKSDGKVDFTEGDRRSVVINFTKPPKLSPGDKVWLSARESGSIMGLQKKIIMAHASLEDAVESVLNDYYLPFLSSVLENFCDLDEEYESDPRFKNFQNMMRNPDQSWEEKVLTFDELKPSKRKIFDEYMKKEEFPSPFTRANLSDYMMKNGYFSDETKGSDPTEAKVFQFFEAKYVDRKTEILKNSKKKLSEVAYIWAMKDVHQKTNYDRFFDMLLEETDDRWALPHYFLIKLEESHEALSDLVFLLDRSVEYDVLYEDYVKETRELLKKLYPEDAKINRLFFLYDEFVANEEKEGSFYDKLEEGDEILGNIL